MAVWALTLGCLLATSAFAQEVEEQRRAVLEQQVRTQLGEYADDFPELRFMVLEGSPEEALGHLDSRLGRAPVSLDYEHPTEMRSHLVALALERVRIMLEANAPSASLLQPTADARPLCVITLAPCAIARDDRTATCHFLGLSPEQGELIAREAYLPCEDYLAFVLDHEAYHCLDAWHHGPQPVSFAEHWAAYWQFRGENGADAYAMGRHLQRSGVEGPFPANFARIRDWSLLHGEADHWTGRSLARLEANRAEFAELSARASLLAATHVRDTAVGDYPDFLRYRASLAEALRRVGQDPGDGPASEPGSDRSVEPDPALVAELIQRIVTAHEALVR